MLVHGHSSRTSISACSTHPPITLSRSWDPERIAGRNELDGSFGDEYLEPARTLFHAGLLASFVRQNNLPPFLCPKASGVPDILNCFHSQTSPPVTTSASCAALIAC